MCVTADNESSEEVARWICMSVNVSDAVYDSTLFFEEFAVFQKTPDADIVVAGHDLKGDFLANL